jgi:hypothetical protein
MAGFMFVAQGGNYPMAAVTTRDKGRPLFGFGNFRKILAGAFAPVCSPIARCVKLANNPKGWQRVAGGRNAVKTPGDGVLSFGILKGCQNAATPAGSVRNLGMGSRGYRCAQPPATFWQTSGLLLFVAPEKGQPIEKDSGGFSGRPRPGS